MPGLTKRHRSFDAVKNASFTLEKGEIFAFLGSNGAGNSTTMEMSTTVLGPTSGKIIITGCDPVTESYQVRRSFGIPSGMKN